MEIYLLTSNEGKLKAAKSTFDKYGVKLLYTDKDYAEIQADSSLEIAKNIAQKAAKELNAPVIREDHSLFIEALGIPGPYMNYVERKIPADLISKIINSLGNNKGWFEVSTVYAEPDGTTFEYTFKVPMTFGNEQKGINPKGWNDLIRLNNETRAITEYPEEERLHIWSEGYEAVVKYLMDNNKLSF
ncbi:MAG: hypothetical protein NTV03_03190 [Candidatus Nomurabacteria bacterium]|nr:hypothetical protein [Candidatus Nomurabacteria bacterium]